MKKTVIFGLILFTFALVKPNFAFADLTEEPIERNIKIQERISNIGLRILNANKTDVRMIFVYNAKQSRINTEPSLRKREILINDKNIQFAADDNETAAYLAREIAKSAESYTGMGHGFISAVQIKCAPKKYELFFDKCAADLMVKAGYNPLALITYINKAYPQKRFDKLSRTNLTSRRLANLYEYIYIKYPYYLKYNDYLENESYQNFLLTSVENRRKLAEKIKSGSKKAVNYE